MPSFAALADRQAAVGAAIGDHRPAVVDAGAHDVDLVAAARPVLLQPEPAGLRVHGQPLRVAVAVAEDLGPGARAADERIVLRHAAVGMQAHHLAGDLAQILRALALAALAQRDEQIASRSNARREPKCCARRRAASASKITSRSSSRPSPRRRARPACRRRPRRARHRTDRSGDCGELGIERDIQQTRPARSHRPPARPRAARIEHALAQDAQASRPLGDQRSPSGRNAMPQGARGPSRPRSRGTWPARSDRLSGASATGAGSPPEGQATCPPRHQDRQSVGRRHRMSSLPPCDPLRHMGRWSDAPVRSRDDRCPGDVHAELIDAGPRSIAQPPAQPASTGGLQARFSAGGASRAGRARSGGRSGCRSSGRRSSPWPPSGSGGCCAQALPPPGPSRGLVARRSPLARPRPPASAARRGASEPHRRNSRSTG